MSDAAARYEPPLFGLSQRLPPSNIQAEQSLLGTLLANNSAFDRVSSFLRPEHFADPIHGRIYEAIVRRIDAGQLADAVTLKGDLENSGILDEVGGTAYLAQLLTAMVGILNAGEYGRAILDAAIKRKLIELGESIVNNAFGADIELDGLRQIELAQDQLAELSDATDGGSAARGPRPIGEAVRAAVLRAEARHRGEQVAGVATGISTIDKAFGRFLQPATVTYLAGLGESGKTALALQIADNASAAIMRDWQRNPEGRCPGVLFFSGDMKDEQIGFRMASRLSNLHAKRLRAGQLDDATCLALESAQATADAMPLELDDNPSLSLGYVVRTTQRVARRRPLVGIVIDNLSKLVGEEDVNAQLFPLFLRATNTLKKLCTRLDIWCLLLLHLPQSVAKRDNPKPKRGDLPYGIHMHADYALGLWRPELSVGPRPEQGKINAETWSKMDLVTKWEKRKAQLRFVAEVVPLKMRENDGDGGMDDVRLIYDEATSSFREPGFSDVQPADLWS